MTGATDALLERHQGALALTAKEMPFTSHWAAASVDTTKMEKTILDALITYGPMTSEQIAIHTGHVLTSITPRMAALHERNIVKRLTSVDGEFVTQVGKSGCQRLVYEFNEFGAEWLQKRPTKPNRAEKIRQLEAEITRLNTIINNLKRGNLNDEEKH